MSAPILIVDDDPDILDGLSSRLQSTGYATRTAKDGAEALTVIQQEKPALMLLDLQMPTLGGLDVLRQIRVDRNELNSSGPIESSFPVIVLTAFGTINQAVEAMKLGASDFITKPFDPDHLDLLVRNVLERHAWKRELRHLRSDINSRYSVIIAESPKMKSILECLRRAATSDAGILLDGETGTGKELLAHSIHQWSSRWNKSFVVVNCAALPEQLLENELFGHERGAYTGATHRHVGKIEAADGGTVFLDEIGELPLPVQSRFLRLLQDKEFHRVGGTQRVRVDIRFIAATNKDLAQAVQRGTFREDLFYRIHVYPVTIPPLRERPEDISHLAKLILERESSKYGRMKPTLSDTAIEALTKYHWPGNIRELENVLARALILAEGQTIQECHLGLRLDSSAGLFPSPAKGLDLLYHASMQAHSCRLLDEALRQSKGNQTKAAVLLGLQRTYLTKLLRKKKILSHRLSTEGFDQTPPPV